MERRKTLIPLREAEVLAFSGTTRLTTCGTPLSAGGEAAVRGLTLVGGWLRSLEAGYVAERPGIAAARSLRGYSGEQKGPWVVRNGLSDLAWHEECLHVHCNGLEVLHGKERDMHEPTRRHGGVQPPESRLNDCRWADSVAHVSRARWRFNTFGVRSRNAWYHHGIDCKKGLSLVSQLPLRLFCVEHRPPKPTTQSSRGPTPS